MVGSSTEVVLHDGLSIRHRLLVHEGGRGHRHPDQRPPAGPLPDILVLEGSREAGRHGWGGYVQRRLQGAGPLGRRAAPPRLGEHAVDQDRADRNQEQAFDYTYDFATFIVTVPGTPIPDWLPKTRIWYDLQRFGLDGAAGVLAARIQERGGAAVGGQ